MKILHLLLATVFSLAITTATQAALSGSYDWTAYNTQTIGASLWVSPAGPANANVTDYSIDDSSQSQFHSGGSTGALVGPTASLKKISDGTATGATVALSFDDYNSWYNGEYRMSQGGALVSGNAAYDTFNDIMGPNYGTWGIVGGDTNTNTVRLTFAGLDPTKKYSFAAISTGRLQSDGGDGRATGSIAKVSIDNEDAFTNNSVQSVIMGGAGGNNYKITSATLELIPLATVKAEFDAFASTSAYAYLSHAYDDMIRFDDINPGADGSFDIVWQTALGGEVADWVTTVMGGNANDLGGIDSWVLGQQGAALAGVPEPNALLLGALGLLGLLLLGGRRFR